MRSKTLILYFISILLGVSVGLVGASFRFCIEELNALLTKFFHLIAEPGWLVGLTSGFVSMLMVLAAFFAVKYIAPEASGSGVQEIEGALLHVRPIFWRRLLPVKFFFGILALSSKMILGREGPIIHIGGNLGEMLGSIFNLSRRRRDSLVAAGAAAGLAVAFNAPLAGAIFVMEEMRNQFNYSFTSFNMVVIACTVATVILELLLGTQPTIPMPVFEFPALSNLWLFALFGVIVGFAGLLFNQALMKSLILVNSLSTKHKIYYVAVIGFVVGVLAIYYPFAVGDGSDIIHQAVTISPGLHILFLLFIVRFMGSMACYSSGVPGGIFAPILALGTLLGVAVFQILVFFHLDFSTQPGMFAVAGMAALFAAATRAPITGGVLVIEMTQNYSLILPLMMTCLTATIILQLARNAPIYEQLLDWTLHKEKMLKKSS